MSFFGTTPVPTGASVEATATAQGWLKSWFFNKTGNAIVGVEGKTATSIPIQEKETPKRAPRFAAEFDGIDFFETIVTR